MGTVSNTKVGYLEIDFIFIQKHFIFHGTTTLAALGLLFVKALPSHSLRQTQSAGLVWTSVRPSQISL
jgi:hypothetical protein